MPPVYFHSITVIPQDLDELNHVNNVVYLRWVQDTAAAHWNNLMTEAIRRQFLWVVLRHEIDYKNAAVLNDEISAKTWVSSVDGPKSVRIVQLFRKSDGKLLAEAKTTWCLLNVHTYKPVRIGDGIKEMFLGSRPHVG